MKWTREPNVFTDLFIHVEPEGLKCHCRTKQNFPTLSIALFCVFLVVSLLLSFLSLWNDWKLLRFLWAARFYWRGRAERDNFCICPLRNGLRFCWTCLWLRWGRGRARTERLSCSGWGTLTRRVKKHGQTTRRVDRLGGGAVCQAQKLRRNRKRCACSPFLAAERDVLFHQSCEAFRPCGYLITLISARLSLFRWTSGILMKAVERTRSDCTEEKHAYSGWT